MNYEANDILFRKNFPLCNKCIGDNKKNRWNPIQVNCWEGIIKKVIPYESKKDENYLIAKNIIYNLQFIEFIGKCFKDLHLGGVLQNMLIKSFVISSISIIESILYFNFKDKMNLKNKNDYKFIDLIENAKKHKLYNDNDSYSQLEKLSKYQDKVRIFFDSNNSGTDFISFDNSIMEDTMICLHMVLQSWLQLSDEENKKYLYFLNKPINQLIPTLQNYQDLSSKDYQL